MTTKISWWFYFSVKLYYSVHRLGDKMETWGMEYKTCQKTPVLNEIIYFTKKNIKYT